MKDNGGPAFPRIFSESSTFEYPASLGMTLRDYFACQTLTAWIEKIHADMPVIPKEVAKISYEIADAMIEQREK